MRTKTPQTTELLRPAPVRVQRLVRRRAIAEKWGCTLKEVERKIQLTMRILAVDRDNAIAFLVSVHPGAIVKPPNDKLSGGHKDV